LHLLASGDGPRAATLEMQVRAIQRTRLTPALRRNFAAVVAIGVFLTFTDPFGATSRLPLWGSFLYWTALVGEGWFGAPLIGATIRNLVPQIPPLLNRLASTVLVAVLVTATIVGVQMAIGAPVPSSFWPSLYGLVLGISIAIAAVAWLLERAFSEQRPGTITHGGPGDAPSRAVRFLDRLPPKLKGAALYAISAEDHYLRLHTSKGSDLILMRLSDALAVGGEPGEGGVGGDLLVERLGVDLVERVVGGVVVVEVVGAVLRQLRPRHAGHAAG
jgi:hypothetical protein